MRSCGVNIELTSDEVAMVTVNRTATAGEAFLYAVRLVFEADEQ